MTCAKEQMTMHHEGEGHGHGCVRDAEEVVMAICGSTVLNSGNLCGDSFPVNQLKKAELSLARRLYTDFQAFDAYVVTPKASAGDPVLGVTTCLTKDLRDLCCDVHGAAQPIRMRAVCVLDWVLPRDHVGHAALEFSEDHGNLSPKQRGRLRSVIVADLADLFSPIVPVASIFT